MVLKVCMVIVIIFSRSLFIGKVFAFEKKSVCFCYSLSVVFKFGVNR